MTEKEMKECAEERAEKRKLRAPCLFVEYNDRLRREIESYPAVSCAFRCDRCGWNPVVKQQRIEKIKAELEARKKVKQ